MKKHEKLGLAATAMAALVALGGCTADDPPARASEPGSGPGAPTATSPDIPQAKWKIKAHPSGNLGKISKSKAKSVRAQRRPLRKLVAKVYYALFLDPARRDGVLRASFHPRAARAIAKKAGVPKNARDVRTTMRKADIGIDFTNARRAAAVVKVRARGFAGERKFEIAHRATLWLERSKGKWKVIAFEVRQRPAR